MNTSLQGFSGMGIDCRKNQQYTMTMRHLKSMILIALCIAFASFAFAADKDNSRLAFDIFVTSDTNRHVQWLAYPSYLAVALENNGLSVDSSKKMLIRDEKSLKFDKFLVSYVGERGNAYIYTIDVYLPIGGKFEIPVEIDTSSIKSGKLTINVKVPLSEYLPQNYKEHMGQMINRLTDAAIQSKLSDYLDGINAKLGSSQTMEKRIELLMIDSYNRRFTNTELSSGGEHRRGVPIAENILSIGALVILLGTIILGIVTLVSQKYKKEKE